MPRPRLSQQFSHHAIPQPPNPAPGMAMNTTAQQRNDCQVQRSNGAVIISSGKQQQQQQHQSPVAPQPLHLQQSHLQQPLAHFPNQLPAHQQAVAASMFQHHQQFPTGFMTNPMMSMSLPTYYHQQFPMGIPPPVTSHPTLTSTTSNEVYTPNGATNASTINYDDFMQAPPPPVRSKPKRRSRRQQESSSSDSDFLDDSDDPDYSPARETEEFVEPTQQPIRGRRTSTGRGRGRGSRGGGGGRGRGRGRGRAGGMNTPPSLEDQSQLSTPGRHMRSGQVLNMPSLDPETGQMSFGEMVSAAVNSLNEPDDEGRYSGHHRQSRKQAPRMAASLIKEDNGKMVIQRVPASSFKSQSLFIPVDTSAVTSSEVEVPKGAAEEEEEELIMTYEIVQEEDRQRPFLCEACGKSTKSRVLHNQHLITHYPSARFACCICSQLFTDHDKLKPHLRTHHGKGIFVCPDLDCEGIFQERKSLDDHEFVSHPDARPHVCRYCRDRFATIEETMRHEDGDHPEDTSSTCLKCDTTCDTKTAMKEHVSYMHEEKECQFCKEKFVNQPALTEHQEAKHAEELKPKPPTPEPSPEPPSFADDDQLHSPGGGDDDDDIVVVGEQKKKSSSSKRSSRGRPKAAETKKQSKPPPSQRPGPKSSKTSAISNNNLKKSSGVVSSNDVITLSSDSEEEKDPTWKVPEGVAVRSGHPSTRRTSRRTSEFVVVVESDKAGGDKEMVHKKPQKATEQVLTFMMGKSGDLVHVPSDSDPHPPNSLPMSEIMKAIKGRKLNDNTTIIIRGDKVASVKTPGDKIEDNNKRRPPAILKKWVRPPAPEPIPGTSKSFLESRPGPSSKVPAKPIQLVAKKRTGGLVRKDRDRDHEKEKEKTGQAGPIAKKRTGGSRDIYESAVIKPPKRKFHDDEEVLLVESDSEDRAPRSKSNVSFKLPPKPVASGSSRERSNSIKKGKKSKKKKSRPKSKSERRQEKERKQVDSKQAARETDLEEYDGSPPKRSLRIALKASVADTNYDEDRLFEDATMPKLDPIGSNPPPQRRGAGRPSANVNRSEESILPTASSDGQVVMKAMVNGKWQDVVIGTKLPNDQQQPGPSSLSKSWKPERPAATATVNSKKNTQSNKRPAPSYTTKSTAPRGGAKKRAGRKPKNPAADSTADYWRDDRYQYFSDAARTMDTSSHIYSVPATSYVDKVEYSFGEGGHGGYEEQNEDQDLITPFSLSSYMTNMSYHEDQDTQQQEEPDDQGLPVIVNAYHLDDANVNQTYGSATVADDPLAYGGDENVGQEDYGNEEGGDQIEEVPLYDPLAMDEGPAEEADEEVDEEDEAEADPLADSSPAPEKPPPAPVVVTKGTKEDAKSAVNNLRFVLSQITFKK